MNNITIEIKDSEAYLFLGDGRSVEVILNDLTLSEETMREILSYIGRKLIEELH